MKYSHALLLNLLILLISASCQLDNRASTIENMNADEMKRFFKANLPIGIARDQAIEFLQARNIEYVEVNQYPTTPYGEANLEWISLIFGRASWLGGEYKIAVELYFDKESKRLVRHNIYESYRCL